MSHTPSNTYSNTPSNTPIHTPPQPLQVVFLPPHHWECPADSDEALRGKFANSLLHHLAQQGVRWTVINPGKPPWNPLGRKNAFLSGLDFCRALRVLLRHRRADVIVSVFESNGFFILLLRRLLGFAPRVVLWDASTGNPWRWLQRLQRFVLPRYDSLMMLTSVQCRHLQQHYRLRGSVQRIGYNVDEAFYQPVYGEERDYVLSVGDDISRDFPTLMAAAALLPQVRFICKTKWRPPAGTDAPPNVSFVSERLPRALFRDLYIHARLVVCSLHVVEHAGGITALFEAMAMGKPLVATDTPVSRDFVNDQQQGLLVPPGDAAALAAAIVRLNTDADLRKSLALAARRHVEQDLSTQALALRMHEHLRSLCGRELPPLPPPGGNRSVTKFPQVEPQPESAAYD